jgi:hypothetical protein
MVENSLWAPPVLARLATVEIQLIVTSLF